MTSLLEGSKNDHSCLFDKFAKICPEKTMGAFTNMRKILENPTTAIQKPWDIYFLYSDVMKIAKEMVHTENLKPKRRFISILQAFQDKTITSGESKNIKFNFNPMIKMINEGKTELSCTSEIVNFQDDLKVQEAALAIDSLMQEGIGLSFGVKFLSKRIKSKEGLCVIARNDQNRIIAAVLGTNLHIIEKNYRVFHFNVLVRSPNYPLINFTYMLQKFETDLIKKFNPDYLSLCVDMDNPAKKIYEKVGFAQSSVQYNQTLRRDAIFMVKSFNDEIKEKPSLAEVRSSLDLINQKENRW